MSVLTPLVGLEVDQVWVWWSVRLVFDLGAPDSQGTYVDVNRFEFIDPAGVMCKVNVEEDPVAAGCVLAVLHRRVTEASAVAWELRLAFDNGALILCQPDPQHEAWAASFPGHSMFCPPGGDPTYTGE